MAKPHWFRRTTWSERDAVEFENQLTRSRSVDRKAQYVRIQAVQLQALGDYTRCN